MASRSDEYFHKDSVILKIEDTLYRLSEEVFLCQSSKFADLWEDPRRTDPSIGKSEDNPVVIPGAIASEYDCLFAVMFGHHASSIVEMTTPQLVSVLDLSVQYYIPSAWQFAVANIMRDTTLTTVERFRIATSSKSLDLFIEVAVELAFQLPSFFAVEGEMLRTTQEEQPGTDWHALFADLIHRQIPHLRRNLATLFPLMPSPDCLQRLGGLECDHLTKMWPAFAGEVGLTRRCLSETDMVALFAFTAHRLNLFICGPCEHYAMSQSKGVFRQEEQHVRRWANQTFCHIFGSPDI